MVQQAFTGGRQAHATRVAVQQRGTQGGFQVRQAFADSRRCNELALGGLADAAELAHGNKQLQGGQVNAAGEVAVGGLHGQGIVASDGFAGISLSMIDWSS